MPAFAASEKEQVYDGAVGWTPIAVGVASPLQLPWGRARWDVFGLDCNLFYSDAPKMYGIGVGGIAMATRDDLKGTAAFNAATAAAPAASVALPTSTGISEGPQSMMLTLPRRACEAD